MNDPFDQKQPQPIGVWKIALGVCIGTLIANEIKGILAGIIFLIESATR